VWFRAGDDLEHEICRQRWSLRRCARASSSAFRPWCRGLPAWQRRDALLCPCRPVCPPWCHGWCVSG
jgi:hypothetical protein